MKTGRAMNLDSIRDFFRDIGLGQIGRWAVMTMLVGAVAAGAAILFDWAQVHIENQFLGGWANYYPPGHESESASPVIAGEGPNGSSRPVAWALVAIPMLGGLASGLLVFLIAPEAEGHGTDAVIRSYHRQGGHIRWKVPIVKLAASAITIGTGGSAGREGPIAQIGAGFASWIGGLLGISERERRTLVLAGVAAGIGAMFQAPLGGAFLAAEVLYRRLEFEAEALIPGVMASILSYALYCQYSGKGFTKIFQIPDDGMVFDNPLELVLYAIVGVALAATGALYVKVFDFTRLKIFRPLPIPAALKPMIGGFLVGIIALFFTPVLGVSYSYLVDAIEAPIPQNWASVESMVWFFLLLGFLKIVATSLTIGSGGSGGVFAPSLVIGGSFGAVFGLLFGVLFPNLVTRPGAYVLIGMGGFFSGVAKVPFTSLIMVCEMTNGYGLVVPLMLVTALTYLLSGQQTSIYAEQVPSRIDSPAHQGEFMIDVLEKIRVSEVMVPLPNLLAIREDTALGEVLKLSTQTTHQAFPVLDSEGKAVGVVSLEDVRAYYYQSEIGQLVIAGDIARPLERIEPSDDLNTALGRLVQAEFEEYPVLDEGEPDRVVGLISRHKLLDAYNEKLKELKSPSE